jgi:tetratricopeptide (TPR) repeat protein
VIKAIVKTLQNNMQEALRKGLLGEAEDILARLKKEDPLSQTTRGLELEFYLNSNRFREAEALSEQLCRLFPDSARIAFLTGKLAYRQKNYEKAETYFRESLRLFPHWQSRHWLGKTLTQTGVFKEAESLLLSVLESHRHALLDLAWLHERRNDLDAALKAYDDFLEDNPGNSYASEQQVRLRAKKLAPEDLISEVSSLTEMDEAVPAALIPEFIQKLFDTVQSPRAREEVIARMNGLDAKTAVQVAWVCYRAHAYDLACTLFLSHLCSNQSNFKYLNALESAAGKCNRLPELLEAYRALVPGSRHFYGRWKSLTRRLPGNHR